MNKNFKLLFAFALVVTMISSCKKATSDTSFLTSHKWVVSASIVTYNDSVGVTRNLIQPDTICQTSSYTEFHDRTPNNSLRLAYTYYTTNCPTYRTPEIGITSWDIDADNANLYLGGNTTDGTGGTWYTLTSINGSTMVITDVQQRSLGSTGYPNYTPVYDIATYTKTYSVK